MEFWWRVIPETWCSDGYGSVGEYELGSNRVRETMREKDDLLERVGWMVKSLRR